jgi:hypothetical protein
MMRSLVQHRVPVVLAALLALWSAACSAGPEGPPPEPTVDDIVAAHIAARGGAERLHALQSMRATGLAIGSGGRVAPVVREIERPGRIRLEFTYQGLSGVYAHDGEVGWQVAPLEGRFDPEPLPAAVAAPSVDQLDIEGPLLDWRAKGHQVTLVGRAEVGGRDAYELEVRLAGGALRRDFIDAESWMLVRTDVERVVGSRRLRLETTFSDFRAVGGLVYPHVIETRAQGRPRSLRVEVETIELDPEIDDARFRFPR